MRSSSGPKRDPLVEDAERLLPAGTIVDGQYEIRRCLGRGGMGLIFRVSDNLDREYALKMLVPHLHERFAPQHQATAMLVKEAKRHVQLAELKPERFVQIFRRGEIPVCVENEPLRLPYYVMELLQGYDFQRMIQIRRAMGVPLSVRGVLDLAKQAAEGLVTLHDARIVHRDVKSNNFYIHQRHDREPAVKLLDCGISTEEGEKAKLVTGTARYAAPEYLRGDQRTESCASDIYPFGLVLYEIAAFRGPYDDVPAGKRNVGYWHTAHLRGAPPPLSRFRPDLPAELVVLVAGMLESQPTNRPTGREILASLEKILLGLPQESGSSLSETLRTVDHERVAVRVRNLSNVSSLLTTSSLSSPQHSEISNAFIRDFSSAPRESAPRDDDLESRIPTLLGLSNPELRQLAELDTSPSEEPEQRGPRVFNSVSEIFDAFDAVWEDDTRYHSSPLYDKPWRRGPSDGPVSEAPRGYQSASNTAEPVEVPSQAIQEPTLAVYEGAAPLVPVPSAVGKIRRNQRARLVRSLVIGATCGLAGIGALVVGVWFTKAPVAASADIVGPAPAPPPSAPLVEVLPLGAATAPMVVEVPPDAGSAMAASSPPPVVSTILAESPAPTPPAAIPVRAARAAPQTNRSPSARPHVRLDVTDTEAAKAEAVPYADWLARPVSASPRDAGAIELEPW